MSDLSFAFLLFIGCTAASAILTRLVLSLLERRAILDHPNERSSHARPTPRGGGIAVVIVLIAAWILIAWEEGPISGLAYWPVIAGIAALALLSWIDDLRGLSAGLRVGCHAIIVIIALASFPADALVFQGVLPLWADRVASALLWIWFINLFNFMDGIDGISGVEAVAIGGGLYLVTLAAGGVPGLYGVLGLLLAGAAAGFLVWNWHPARLFLGDVGSVPLGFALGWLLLQASTAGWWAAALILPLYYLADATVTLTRRAARGEKVWQAHREHFYQQAVARGLSHAAVAGAVAVIDLALIAAAMASVGASASLRAALLPLAAVLVGGFLAWLGGAFVRRAN